MIIIAIIASSRYLHTIIQSHAKNIIDMITAYSYYNVSQNHAKYKMVML